MESQDKKMLVLQYRTDNTKDHEVQCFHEELGDYELDIIFEDATQRNLHRGLLEGVDAVVFGGSGEFFLTQGHGKGEWLEDSFDLIDHILEDNIPLLGICFGSQILTLHQGGKLTDSEEYREPGGTEEVFLNEKSQQCELFSQLPERFKVQLGHKDTPIESGEDMINLAYSNQAPIHAFTIREKPAWGVLFHPELNEERVKNRLTMLPSFLPGEDNLYSEIFDNVESGDLGHLILHRFLDTFIFDFDQKKKKKREATMAKV